ncbi:hypothetical protein N9B73_06785 [Verrucomicrobiales bacterium]|nr:hypothetical protein [Verrucomicrobiales bacterium]|tara:strand:- start:211 stop:411 length:201 start_codon:yes stop_codon:yes gene_type:complete
MKNTRNVKQRQRGFAMGNMLFVLALAGSLYVAKGQLSGPNVEGQPSSQVVKELGQPVAKETIPRPS